MSDKRSWRRGGTSTAARADRTLEVVTSASTSTVAVLTRQPTFLMQLRHAGLDVVEGRDVDHLAVLSKDAAVAVIDLTRADGRRGLVARISTTVDPKLPLVLISADTVDLAILGGTREVHVVVPPLRAEDVVACVERVLLDRQSRQVEQLASSPPVPAPTVLPAAPAAARPPAAPGRPTKPAPPARPAPHPGSEPVP